MDNNLFSISLDNTISFKEKTANEGYIPNIYSFSDNNDDNPANVVFIILTPEGLIKEVNNAGLALLGVERNNIINKHFLEFVSFKDAVNWSRFMSCILHDRVHNIRHNCEIALSHKGQSDIYVRIDGVFLTHKENDRVLRLILTDITARKKAESALNASETRFLNIIKDLEPLRQTVRPERMGGYY